MQILCIFAKYPLGDSTNIVKDLANAFHRLGHQVNVVTIKEKRFQGKTNVVIENGYKVLRVKTGNLFDKVALIEKFITMLKLPGKLYRAIIKFFANESYDLIITHTPYMASYKLIRKLKKYYLCPALLILWDIFPQNALDLGILHKGLLYSWLKHQEKLMFKSFNYINCMSKGNKTYLLKHYPYLNTQQLLVNYNWGEVNNLQNVDKAFFLRKYGYRVEDKLCIFGGNFGRPQAVENLAFLAEKLSKIKFIFVGNGTEYTKLKRLVAKLKNVRFFEYLQRNEYEQLVQCCKVGLISLDSRFTVPNFPSKTTDYLKYGLPIFAILDSVSAKDYGHFIVNEAKVGSFILSKRLSIDYQALYHLLTDPKKLNFYAKNGREFFKNRLGVDSAAKNLLQPIVELN